MFLTHAVASLLLEYVIRVEGGDASFALTMSCLSLFYEGKD